MAGPILIFCNDTRIFTLNHRQLQLFRGRMEYANPRPNLASREEVMFFDTDCGGVVHNLAYLRMIETNRTRLGALLGLDLATMAATRVFPVVLRTEIDYRRPAVLGDTLVIHGELECLAGIRFWCRFTLAREAGDLLVTARQQLALVEMPGGKPRRLPADWQARYGHLQTNTP
jgi:YbgC/YbaW family acyl-CoA thioester hydrolase